MVDENARALVASMPVPTFDKPAFVAPPPLTEATVALVTTAGLMHPGEPWNPNESKYRVFDREDRDLIIGHPSMNFDRSGSSADRNVVYPIDRLEEFADNGVIGRVGEHHLSFMGGVPDLTEIIVDTGPDAGKLLKSDGVHIVLLTPACPVCPRTVATLAHIFEQAGLATVAYMSNLDVACRIRPPRALFCDFPIGRPLGVPGDSVFQRAVLQAGLALLDDKSGPVLVTYPVAIHDEAEHPVACSVPPVYDDSRPPAVAEAKGLRSAYDRARDRAGGHSNVGRMAGADGIVDVVDRLAQIAVGTPWSSLFESANVLLQACMDVRVYYEEAAIGLADHVPAARSSETWFYRETKTGELMVAVIDALRSDFDPFPTDLLLGMVPMSQPHFVEQLMDELMTAANRLGVEAIDAPSDGTMGADVDAG